MADLMTRHHLAGTSDHSRYCIDVPAMRSGDDEPVWPALDPDDDDRLPILERVLEGLRSLYEMKETGK
jgi:hypothetical protein